MSLDIVSGWKYYAWLFLFFLHLCSVFFFYCLADLASLSPLILVPPSSYHCTALFFLLFFWSLCRLLYQIKKKKGILSTDLFSQSFPGAFSCHPIRIPICLRQNKASNTFSCPGPLTRKQTQRHTRMRAHTKKKRKKPKHKVSQQCCEENKT